MLQRTRCARAAEPDALLTVQQYGQSASGKVPPLACAPLCSVFAPQPPPLHHCAARDANPHHQPLAVRRRLGQWVAERAAPAPRFGCGRLRRLLCGGVQHNGVLCKARAPGQQPPALRVRIRGRYVLRPAGKHRHQFSPSPPLGAGSKTGLVQRRPFAFCCKVLRGCLVCLWCGRCAVWLLCGGSFAPPTPPALCGRGCATTAPSYGGRFPANAPQPPGGQVKQKHARTRSCFHPRPVQPRIHAGSAALCVLPCPLDRAAAGGGHTQAVGCAGCCLKWCGRGFAATALHLNQNHALTDTQESGELPLSARSV